MRKIIAVFTALLCAMLVGCTDNSAGVGIIGGADGPTAILIASRLWGVIAGVTVATVVAVCIAVIAVFKRRK